MEENSLPKSPIEQNPQTQIEDQPVTPPGEVKPPQLFKPKKYNKNLILIILFVLLLTTLGFFVFQNYNLRKSVSQATPPPTGGSQPSPTTDPTTDWKTYTNLAYKYSVQYPPQWLLSDLTQGKSVEIYYQPDKTVSVGSILIEVTTETNYKNELAAHNNLSQILFGNVEAQCFTDNLKTWCLFTSNNKYFDILTIRSTDQNYNKILDQILSTFKFTD